MELARKLQEQTENVMTTTALNFLKEGQTELNGVIKAIAKAGLLDNDDILRAINNTKQKLYALQDVLQMGSIE